MTFRSLLSTIAALSLGARADACPEVRAHGPNVAQGGRAVAIAVRPDADTHLVVASETGGLFRSTNAARRGGVGGLRALRNGVSYGARPDVLTGRRARDSAPRTTAHLAQPTAGGTWTQPAARSSALRTPSRRAPTRCRSRSRAVWVATTAGCPEPDGSATWTPCGSNRGGRAHGLPAAPRMVGECGRSAGGRRGGRRLFQIRSPRRLAARGEAGRRAASPRESTSSPSRAARRAMVTSRGAGVDGLWMRGTAGELDARDGRST